MSTELWKHPEERANEQFVGNTRDGIRAELASLETARLGRIAYDINHKPLVGNVYRPLFIGEKEYQKYDDIMTSPLRGRI
jgi:hypothetical protein